MKRKLRIVVLLHADLVPDTTLEEEKTFDQDWYTEYSVVRGLERLGHEVEVLPIYDSLKPIRECKAKFRPHIAFNMLEEFNGEAIFDSHVVSYLELLGIKYTGCNSRGLLLARDKALSKKIMSYHRIPTPKFVTMRRGKFKKIKHLRYPLFVKSLNEEASLGIAKASMVADEKALKERVDFIFEQVGTDALIEEFIEGREVYLGLLGNQRVEVFPPASLDFGKSKNPDKEFATRRTKWSEKYRDQQGIELILPKDIEPAVMRKLEKVAKRAFKALNLSGYVRLDVRLKGDTPYILEANPNPAIAPIDEYAVMAEEAGYSYEELLNKILQLGLNYRQT
tara:strand:+ start:28136 stop:29146 length:1011 start_codon:yes stop_codon:yes gene_type:complete